MMLWLLATLDRFDVINVDLPGIGRSPHLEQRPTVAAITDAVEHTLGAAGLDRVHATQEGHAAPRPRCIAPASSPAA